MLNNISLKAKGFIIIGLSLIAMVLLGGYSAFHTKKVMLKEKQVKIQEIVDTAYDSVHYFAERAKKGDLPLGEAQELAKAVIRDVRYNDLGDYIFVYSFDGTNLVHGPKQALQGKNLMGLKDPNGVQLIKELIDAAKSGGGFVNYVWERDGAPAPKLSYSTAYEPWGWMIGTGVYIDDIDREFLEQVKAVSVVILLIMLVIAGTTLYIVRSIINPVMDTSCQMQKIAQEEDVEVTGADRGDELGEMARTLFDLKKSIDRQRQLERELADAERKKVADHKRMMNDVADKFQEQIGSVVSAVQQAASDMQGMATTLAAASEETTLQSAVVSDASIRASDNVQTVASAATQLSASISELMTNMVETEKATRACSSSAEVSREHLETLQKSVADIDSVIQAINDVAEQTNLLALNATIEAARAGDAGKGFAVVANEVKALAGETNKMTDEISGKINEIKLNTGHTITSVQDILEQIDSVNDRTASVSTAIEEQSSATAEISRSAQAAASGTQEVSTNIEQVKSAADDTASATDLLKQAADNLSVQATQLQGSVSQFVDDVRSA